MTTIRTNLGGAAPASGEPGLGATAPGGWSYDYGKGRVCYMSPGHMLSDLWNAEYIRLQQNAVRWLLRQKG